MRKLTLFAAVVVGLVLCCGISVYAGALPSCKAEPVDVTNPPSKPVPVDGTVNAIISTPNPVWVTGTVDATSPSCNRFVGCSIGTTNGDTGHIIWMDAQGQATFGPSARIFTTPE